MQEPLVHARSELQTAAKKSESSVQEQLQSIDEGLMEMIEGDKTQDAPIHEDRLAELAAKLDDLKTNADNEEATRHIEDAAESIETARGRRDTDEE